MAVQELKKLAYTSCAHECSKGCAIYAERPASCAGYSCLWLLEMDPVVRADVATQAPAKQIVILKEEERPDKSGLLFEMSSINRNESDFERTSGIPFLTVREVRPGAFESYWGQKVLKRVSKHALIVRLYQDGRRTAMGPPEKVRVLGQYLQHVRVIAK